MQNMFEKVIAKSFTLTMLGTDTVYNPKLKDKKKEVHVKQGDKVVVDYPKGETLSIISTLIQASEPRIELANPSPYQSVEVAVVNGPETKGSDVGEKIGIGLGTALNAIVRGQTEINIIAHSRGAVESILIAHEMDAVKKIIGTCENFDQLIKHISLQQTERQKIKTLNNTPDIIKALTAQLPKNEKEKEKEDWFLALKTNMASTSINLFAIDPVPGDCWPVTWVDQRFFILPEIIKNAEFIYYENERSDWGFTPINPVASSSKQNVLQNTMPGNHGTGSSGNNGSQQKIVVSPPNKAGKIQATHVQKLIVCKLLDFLTNFGVKFKDGTEIFHDHSGLGTKYIKKMLAEAKLSTETIDITKLDFPKIYRELYAKIAENRTAYEAFNTTHYTLMGVAPQRKVLSTGHKYGLLTEIFPKNMGYVNEEHNQLMKDYFFKIFNLGAPENHSLTALINSAHEVLEKNIRKITDISTSISLIALDEGAHQPILDNSVTQEDVLSTFGALIQRVSQQYLTNDWSTHEKQAEKLELFTAIISILQKFELLLNTQNESIKLFVEKLIKMSLSGITRTVGEQHSTIEEEFNRLLISKNEKLKFFFDSLLPQIKHDENAAQGIEPLIVESMTSEAFAQLVNYPIKEKIKFIWEHLEGKLPALEIEGNIVEKLAMSFEEQYGDSFEDFEKVYHQIQEFINDIEALNKVVPSQKDIFNEHALSLRKKIDALINMAAQRFYKERPNALPEPAEKGTFRELVERHAINRYGVEDRLKAEKQLLQGEKSKLEHNKQQLMDQIKTLETQKGEIEKRLSAEQQKGNEYTAIMNDEKEAKYLLLINQKLLPLTKNYLTLLQTRLAKKTNSPSADETASDIDHKLQSKISIITELLHHLENIKDNPRPIDRLRAFYSKLNETTEKELTLHRDPDWLRYTRNTVLAAGILLSGILPGLIALTIYANIGNSSVKSLLFWHSSGENVVGTYKQHRPTFDDEPEEYEVSQEETNRI